MPEKPEVATQAAQLREALKDRTLVQFWLAKNLTDEVIPETTALQQGQVCNVGDHGKNILIWIRHQGGIYLLIQHLMMTGCWQYNPIENKMLRGYLQTNIGQALYFYDPRKLSTTKIYVNPFQGIYELSLKFGYDWLQIALESSNPEHYSRHFANFESCISQSNRNISAFLMEQRYFAGIGNYLKSEILFSCLVHPELNCKQLDAARIKLIFDSTCRIILAATKSKGVSISDYLDLTGRKGEFVRFVYKQEIDPFYHTEIQRLKQQSRTTYWCPRLQTEPPNPQILEYIQQQCRQRYVDVG